MLTDSDMTQGRLRGHGVAPLLFWNLSLIFLHFAENFVRLNVSDRK